jgi:excisionase family DNA binding protein
MKPRSTTVEKRLVGINEIAKYLDISKATLYSWTLQKRIPHIKMGRLLKFDLQEINEWLKRKNNKSLSKPKVKAKVESFKLFGRDEWLQLKNDNILFEPNVKSFRLFKEYAKDKT